MSEAILPQSDADSQPDATMSKRRKKSRPDDLSGVSAHLANLPEWQPSEFDPFVTLSGAEALATRAVAPLVAAARGYRTVAGEADGKVAARELNLGRPGAGKGGGPNAAARFHDAAASGDVMLIPVHRFDQVVEAETQRREPNVSTHQWRPWETVTMASGKESPKYDFAGGTELPITAHPAMPASWLNGDRTTSTYPPILCAEGQLKADAALSGLLRDAGVSREDLGIKSSDVNGDGTPNVLAARGRLRQIMSNVAPEKRVAILATFSSTTWHGKAEWTQVSFRDRQVWIGMDADVAENPNVWRQASQFWEFIKTKHGSPRLLSPKAVKDRDETKKYGIDDYLAQLGEWSDLLNHLSDELPDNPGGPPEAKKGAYMVDDDGCSVLKAEQYDDTDGRRRYRWVDTASIAAEFTAVVGERMPTKGERRDGVFNPGAIPERSTVRANLGFLDPVTGERGFLKNVRLPAAVMSTKLGDWFKVAERADIPLPSEVHQHPDVATMSVEDERGWLKAVKSTRRPVPESAWTAMGWVPEPGDDTIPAFVAGGTVVSDPGSTARSGFDEGVLAGVSQMGLDVLDPRPFDDPDYQAEVVKDVQYVLETFVDSGTWRVRAVALAVLAIAFRPIIPIRPEMILALYGEKAAGKSWTALCIQSFWHSEPGRTLKTLFGSGSDTTAATEYALARAALWVFDDVAPSVSQNKADRDQDVLGTIIRMVFNGGGKRRSSSGGKQQQVLESQAALIVTAENAVKIESAADRALEYTFRKGHSLHPDPKLSTDLVDACRRTGAPARVTQAFIKYVRKYAASLSPETGTRWRAFVAECEESQSTLVDTFTGQFRESVGSNNVKRHADILTEFMLPLQLFADMLKELGFPQERFDKFTVVGATDLVALVEARAHASSVSSLGYKVHEAARQLLASKRGYIENFVDPKVPPNIDGNTEIATGLGWTFRDDELVTGTAVKLGSFVETKGGHRGVVYDRTMVITEALKHKLLPAGTGENAAWEALVDAGLVMPEEVDGQPTGFKRRRDKVTKRPGTTVQIQKGAPPNRITVSGVPVPLETVLDGAPTDADEEDDDAGLDS